MLGPDKLNKKVEAAVQALSLSFDQYQGFEIEDDAPVWSLGRDFAFGLAKTSFSDAKDFWHELAYRFSHLSGKGEKSDYVTYCMKRADKFASFISGSCLDEDSPHNNQMTINEYEKLLGFQLINVTDPSSVSEWSKDWIAAHDFMIDHPGYYSPTNAIGKFCDLAFSKSRSDLLAIGVREQLKIAKVMLERDRAPGADKEVKESLINPADKLLTCARSYCHSDVGLRGDVIETWKNLMVAAHKDDEVLVDFKLDRIIENNSSKLHFEEDIVSKAREAKGLLSAKGGPVRPDGASSGDDSSTFDNKIA